MATSPAEKDPTLEGRKEGAWREIAAIDAAFERGEIDTDGWHRAMMDLIVPAYLAAENPRAQSGHGGDEKRWEQARRPIVRAIDRSGTFLDVGCASGLLMESVRTWAAQDGFDIEPCGLDISPELAQLARDRLPYWSDRILVGNAADWTADRRFDFVRTCVSYVPKPHRPELTRHLLHNVAAPDGRLIIGVYNEEVERRYREEEVASWGFRIAGHHEVPHPDDNRLVRRVFWIDAPQRSTAGSRGESATARRRRGL